MSKEQDKDKEKVNPIAAVIGTAILSAGLISIYMQLTRPYKRIGDVIFVDFKGKNS
jgi:hypothetical protein